jgi:hypothetical protein
MKKILLTLLILSVILSSQAQTMPINEESGEIEYQEVVLLDSKSKDEIYQNAKTWMLSTLKSSDNMTQLDDQEKNQLIGNGTLMLDKRSGMIDCMVNFKIIIKIKEGRYQYTINNFLHFYYQDGITPLRSSLNEIMTNDWGGKPMKEKKQEEIRKEVDTKIKALINNMKTSILEKNNEDDDW